MDAPHVAHGKAICCPACGDIFTPVFPRAQVVDLTGESQPAEPPADAVILWPIDPAAGAFPPAEAPVPEAPLAEGPAPAPAIPYVPAARRPVVRPAAPGPLPPGSAEAGPLPGPAATPGPPDAQSPGSGDAADALAVLAESCTNHQPPARELPYPEPDERPDGWYMESDNGDLGPFTSRQIAIKAYREEISRDTVLIHPRKGVRVLAGRVPFLFRRSPAASGAPAQAGDGQPPDEEEPGWYVEMYGKEIGPLTTAQVELAAQRGILARDAVLTHPRKDIRVFASQVPRLFPEDRQRTGPVAGPASKDASEAPSMDVRGRTPASASDSSWDKLLPESEVPAEPPTSAALAALQQALADREAKKAETDRKTPRK